LRIIDLTEVCSQLFCFEEVELGITANNSDTDIVL
jgi:hypothetical protein